MSVSRSMSPPLPGQKPVARGPEWQPPTPGAKPAAPASFAAPLPGHKPAAPAATGAAIAKGDAVVDAIRSAADQTGHSFAALVSQAARESGLDPKARNRKSTATGPFQFLERTWLDLMRRHGADYGRGDLAQQIKVVDGAPVVRDQKVRKQILALREDPHLAAGMAARYLTESKERLTAVLKRPATEIESRIAYVMGVNGAGRLIKAAEKTPGAIARDLLPQAAAVNRNLFHDKSGRALTASDVIARLTRRMEADDRRWATLADAGAAAFDDDSPSSRTTNALLLAQQFGSEAPG